MKGMEKPLRGTEKILLFVDHAILLQHFMGVQNLYMHIENKGMYKK
jgi:hypothetical protein